MTRIQGSIDGKKYTRRRWTTNEGDFHEVAECVEIGKQYAHLGIYESKGRIWLSFLTDDGEGIMTSHQIVKA